MMVLDKEDGRWRAGVRMPGTPWPYAAVRGNKHAGTPALTCQSLLGLPRRRGAARGGVDPG